MDKEFKRGMKIVVGGLVLMAVVLIGLSWLGDAKAQESGLEPEPVLASIQEPIDLEDVYLRLRVDWLDKDDITGAASLTCYDFFSEKKVMCYKENKYFDKRQISEKALTKFVNFKREHDLY